MNARSIIEERKKLSVVVPAYNEEQLLPNLVDRLTKTIEENNLGDEIIIVDDGSTDETGKVAEELSRKYTQVKVVLHKRRMGKTTALLTGFKNASGDVLAMIDADLQYAPEDLPKLLDLIEQGYDVVNGWRKDRNDSIYRKIPSTLYNFLLRISFGSNLHDHNSGLKVIRREVLKNITLREGQHRFILNLAHYKGYRVGEVRIQHFPRKYGKTRYGFSRIIVGLLDLISLRLQLSFMERPKALFDLTGLVLLVMGLVLGIDAILPKFIHGRPFSDYLANLVLATLFVITGIQLLLLGFNTDAVANLKAEQRQAKKGQG